MSLVHIPIIELVKDSIVRHCENYNYFPNESNYPTNPYTFFTAYSKNKKLTENDNYWEKGGLSDSVLYTYEVKKNIKLLYIKECKFHNILEDILPSEIFNLLPYNVSDPSFPYECKFNNNPIQTYTWDYIDCGLLAKLTKADGIIRHDECILFENYEEKIDYKNMIIYGNPIKIKNYSEVEDIDIYYRPPEKIIDILKEYIVIKH